MTWKEVIAVTGDQHSVAIPGEEGVATTGGHTRQVSMGEERA